LGKEGGRRTKREDKEGGGISPETQCTNKGEEAAGVLGTSGRGKGVGGVVG